MPIASKAADYNALFVNTFNRNGPPLVRGRGMYLFDETGRKFLDFGAGIAVNALGHNHPLIVKTLKAQGSRLLHVSNYYITKPQIALARLLLKNSFQGRVFLCNSGSEANEGAIKFARKWAKQSSPDKYHILSFTDCFHGRTYGGMSATAQERFQNGFEPMCPGFHYAPFNDRKAAKAILDRFPFAAIIIEPLQAEGGVNTVEAAFLGFLRDYADTHGIALIYDEIQCGMGRTGTLWCYEHFGIMPDIMTLAKPIGGGLPLGAIVCKDAIAQSINPGDHGTTFGGNPLACALGCVVLEEIAKPRFLRRVRERGEYLSTKLCGCAERHPVIESIRGMGLLTGVRLNVDPAPVVAKCKERGLLLIKAEHQTIRFMPPLIVTRADIDAAITIFDAALGDCGW